MSLNVHPDEIVESSKNGLLEKHPSWGRIRVGEFAEIKNGFAFKSKLFNTKGSGVPIVRIRDVGAAASETFYDGEFDDDYWIEPGDLLIGMDGDFRIARWRGPRSLLNQRVCRLRVVDPDQYNDRFLEHVLQGYLDAIHERTSSVTVKHLSSRTVAQIPVPHPSLDAQQRIVEAIEEQFSRLEAGVESLRHAEHNLIRMRASVLEGAVRSDIAGSSRARSGWPTVPLSSVLERLRYGTSTKCSKDGNGRPVLRIPNVRDGQIVLGDLKSAVDPDVDLSRVTAEEGDVLFIRTNGSRDLIGRVGVVTKEAHGMAFASYLIGGRPSPELDSRFLWIVLSSPTWRRRIEGLAATSAGQYNISVSSLKTIQIPLPQIQEQQAIVAEVDRQSSILGVVAGAIATAEARAHRLRRSVLREAFAGHLVDVETSSDLANA